MMMRLLAGLIVLGISGVGAVTAISQHDGASPSSTPAPTSTSYVQQDTRPTSQPPSSTPSASPSTPRPHKTAPAASFVVRVTGRVAWVSVTRPGRRTLFAGLLRHGKTLRFRAHPLDVVIGDAGAVRITVRGRVHSPAGKSGQVLHFTVR